MQEVQAFLRWAPGIDDAFYYLQIARNLAHGKGMTFDGLNATNGVHPLWTLVIVPLFRISASDETYVQCILLLQAVLVLGVVLVSCRLWSSTTLWTPLLLVPAVFMRIDAVKLGLSGLETPLLLLLMTIACVALESIDEHGSYGARPVLLGAILGLVCLARLDAIFFCAGALAAWTMTTSDRSQGAFRQSLILAAATSALVLLPYLIWNEIRFGHLMPISGALKVERLESIDGHIRIPEFLLHRYWPVCLTAMAFMARIALRGPVARRATGSLQLLESASVLLGAIRINPLLILGGALAFSETVVARRDVRTASSWKIPHRSIVALATYAILLLGYESFFYRRGWVDWHYYFIDNLLLPMLVLNVSIELGRKEVPIRLGLTAARAAAVAAALAVCVWQALALHSWRKVAAASDFDNFMTIAYRAAKWARADLPNDAVLIMKDSGIFGFFAHRPVINSDGLVNNFEYQEALVGGSFRTYLRRNGVEYLVQHANWDLTFDEESYSTATYRFYSYMYDSYGDELRFDRSDEVYRSLPYKDGPKSSTRLFIWRIPSGALTDSELRSKRQ
jgi:hypothetical protein